jgi:hypothetical protein
MCPLHINFPGASCQAKRRHFSTGSFSARIAGPVLIDAAAFLLRSAEGFA